MCKRFIKLLTISLVLSFVLASINANVVFALDNEETIEDNNESEVTTSETEEDIISDDEVIKDDAEEGQIDEQRIESNVGYVFDENGFIIEEIDTEVVTPTILETRTAAAPASFGRGFISFSNYSGKVLSVYTTSTGSQTYTYFNTGSAEIIPTLGTVNGRIKVIVNGYTGYINNNSAFRYLTATSGELREYYSINSNNDFVYTYNYFGREASIVTGPAPDFAKSGVKYYSTDGVYFYTSRDTMLSDHSKNNFSNAVNKNPYFNYYQYLPFRSSTNLTTNDFLKFLNSRIGTNTNSVLRNSTNLAEFINVQNTYGVNGAMEFSMAMLESGYGTSWIALNKNNLFGWGAVDSGPTAGAYHFSSVSAGIRYHADNGISSGYLDSVEDSRYRGSNLGNKNGGVNVQYASDPYWGMKISGLYYLMDKQAGFVDYNSNTIAIKTDNSTPAAYFNGKEVYKIRNNYNGFVIKNQPLLVASQDASNMVVYSDVAICNPGDKADYPVIRNGQYSVIKNTCTDGKPFYPADYSFSKDLVTVSKNGMTMIGGEAKSNEPVSAQSITVSELGNGKVEVRLTGVNAPSGLKILEVATWTTKNDQDDLIWYEAKKDTDGSYFFTFNISAHKNETGEYIFHSYAKNSLGTQNFVIHTIQELYKPITADLTVTNSTNLAKAITVSNFDTAKFSAVNLKVTRLNSTTAEKTYTTTLSDNKYSSTVNMSDFNYTTGSYKVEAVGTTTANNQVILATQTFSYTKPTFVTTTTTNTTAGFKVDFTEKEDGNFSEYRVAVWSSYNGEDDIKWTTFTNDNTAYSLDVDVANHNNDSGVYNVKVYAKLSNGTLLNIGQTTYTVESKLAEGLYIDKVDDSNFTIKYVTNTNYTTLKIPVWSDKNGQDDLIWYTAKKVNNNTYVVNVNIASHKNTKGLYIAHVYGKTSANSPLKILEGGEYTVKSFSAESFDITLENGVLKATVNNISAPHGIGKVKIAIWSDKNWQDDLIWYDGTKNGNSYSVNAKIANHKYDTGTYYIHVWAYDSSGQFELVDGTSYNVELINRGDSSVTVDGEKFNLQLSNMESTFNIVRVEAEVSSLDNWQNNSVKYQMTNEQGVYKYSGNVSNHKYANGEYTVKYYGVDSDGKRHLLANDSFTYELKVSGTSKATVNGDRFDLQVSNVTAPMNFKRVEAVVWSLEDLQDDIVYYSMTNNNGTYSVSSDISKHKYTQGMYDVFYLGVDEYGKKHLIARDSFTITVELGATSTINVNKDEFTISLSNVNSTYDIAKIEVNVWSMDNWQDDLVSYQLTETNGVYSVTSNISKHRYSKGLYVAYYMITDTNGKKHYLTQDEFIMKVELNATSEVVVNSNTFNLRVSNVEATFDVLKIEVGVWSIDNGQDDYIEYELVETNGVYTTSSSIEAHNNSEGTYVAKYVVVDDYGTKHVLTDKYFDIEVETESVPVVTDPEVEVTNPEVEVTEPEVTSPGENNSNSNPVVSESNNSVEVANNNNASSSTVSEATTNPVAANNQATNTNIEPSDSFIQRLITPTVSNNNPEKLLVQNVFQIIKFVQSILASFK